jgi:hypothetical protein
MYSTGLFSRFDNLCSSKDYQAFTIANKAQITHLHQGGRLFSLHLGDLGLEGIVELWWAHVSSALAFKNG